MRRAIPFVLAAACSGAAIVGLVLHVSATTGVTVGANVQVSHPGIVTGHDTPTLAQDPRDPDILVATNRIDRPLFSAELDRSIDGGRTWTATALRLPLGHDRPYAPDVAFAPDGTLYVSYVDLEGIGNTPADLWVAKSTDGGRTLSAPVRVAGRLALQPRIAVDRSGTIYLTWLQARTAGVLSLTGGPVPIVLSRSTDAGSSWSTPVQVSDPSRRLVGAATPVIDSRGRLVVMYEDFGADERDFQNLPGPAWDQPFALVVTRPVGQTGFAKGVQLEDRVLPDQRFLVYLPEFPSIAAGPRDALYVAWADARNGDLDVFLRRSGDGGLTWSSAVRVNHNPLHDKTSQYLPQVAVAPDGRVDVLFYDRRRDRAHNVMMDATLATSFDGGRTFSNTRLSTRSFSSQVGSSSAPYLPIDFGSRLALVSTNTRSLAAWTDTRLGSVASGRQDIFAASYVVNGPPGGLAKVGAIVALAVLAFLFAGAAMWRRDGPAGKV